MTMRDQAMKLRQVERTVPGMPASDGAGVKLTRLIGSPRLGEIDPFLMLDEIAPTAAPITSRASRIIRIAASRP